MTSSKSQISSDRAAPPYADFSLPNSNNSLPSHITAEKDSATGKTYYLNHDTKTISWLHPSKKPFIEGLPWPWERRVDVKGCAYYLDHEHRSTSWLDPLKRERFEQDGKLDGDIYTDLESQDCVVEEQTADGRKYWVNYSIGEVGGPDDKL